MANIYLQHGLDPLVVRLQDLLDEQTGKDVRIKLVRKMVEALRDVKTESDLEKTLKELAENLTESNGGKFWKKNLQ